MAYNWWSLAIAIRLRLIFSMFLVWTVTLKAAKSTIQIKPILVFTKLFASVMTSELLHVLWLNQSYCTYSVVSVAFLSPYILSPCTSTDTLSWSLCVYISCCASIKISWIAAQVVTLVSGVGPAMSLSELRVVRVSARPPPKFSAASDFNLWVRRFELYLTEAEIPADKRAREMLSLLEDAPFRIVDQLGLVDSDDYDNLKEQLRKLYAPKGDELEWQYQLQNKRQKRGESLAEFAGELRMMADKAYPDWDPKQRLEIARNQFIQGVESASIQLVLMRKRPKTLDAALELAQQQLSVETAQKRLHRHPLEHQRTLTTGRRWSRRPSPSDWHSIRR